MNSVAQFCIFVDFLSSCFTNSKRGVEISDYNWGFVCFSLKFYHFFPHILNLCYELNTRLGLLLYLDELTHRYETTFFILGIILCSESTLSVVQGHCKSLFPRTTSGNKHYQSGCRWENRSHTRYSTETMPSV